MNDILVLKVAESIVKKSGVLGADLDSIREDISNEEIAGVVHKLVSVYPTPFFLLSNDSATRVFYDKRVGVDVEDVVRAVVYGEDAMKTSTVRVKESASERVYGLIRDKRLKTEGVIVNRLRGAVPRSKVMEAIDHLVSTGKIIKTKKILGNGKTHIFFEVA